MDRMKLKQMHRRERRGDKCLPRMARDREGYVSRDDDELRGHLGKEGGKRREKIAERAAAVHAGVKHACDQDQE